MTSVAVIGAGPAGLTAAYELTKHGMHVDVFEADSSIGGLSKSLRLWGKCVDLGSHIFIPHDPRVASLWSELIGSDYRLVRLRRGIWSRGRIFEYPMKPVDVLRNLGVIQTSLCALSFLATKAPWRRPSDDSAESWIVTRFGRQLFHLFFEDFGKKLFGLPGAEIDPSFAIGLLGNLDRLSLADHFRKRVVQAGGRARAFAGGRTRASGAPRFQHPRQGMGVFCSKLADGLKRRGGSVYLSTRVERLLVAEGKVEGLQIRGAPQEYDWVVSSMPLTVLVRALPDVPEGIRESAQSLKSRNTILVYLRVEAPHVFPYNWLYVYDPTFKVGRITNFEMWNQDAVADDSESIVSMEYWCSDTDDVWTADNAELIDLARDELERTGLISRKLVRDGEVCRIRSSHPVSAKGYRIHSERIKEFISSIDGLLTIGRHGAFSPNSVSDSALAGIEQAERIVATVPRG